MDKEFCLEGEIEAIINKRKSIIPDDLDRGIMFLINHKAHLSSLRVINESEVPAELVRFRGGIDRLLEAFKGK